MTAATGPTGPAGAALTVYNYNLSTSRSSETFTVGQINFVLSYSTSTALSLSVYASVASVPVDFRHTTIYGSGAFEVYQINNGTITSTPTVVDSLTFNTTEETNTTLLRQQDTNTGLWSLHSINILSSAGGLRTTVWIEQIYTDVAVP